MPNRATHIAQAAHNEMLSGYLQGASPHYVDWQVTGLFYAALHYVDAYLASSASGPIHPPTHEVRDALVATERSLRTIFPHYRELKRRSIHARYDALRFTPARLVQLRTDHFDPLRVHVRQLLGLTR